MMKKKIYILAFVFALLVRSNLHAQATANQTLSLLPANPTSTSVIKVVSNKHFYSYSCSLSTASISSSNFQIAVIAYHNVGFAATDCYTKDTTTLGSFAPGNYKLVYTIRHVANNNQYGKDSLFFTVSGSTDLEETEALQHLNLYPNPVKDVLILESEQPGLTEDLEYNLFNLVGQEIVSARIKEHNKPAINLKELPAGIYFIRFNYKGQSITKKISKE